jgi:hypothetical protein
MSILYRLVILMELLGYKGIDVRSNDKGGSIITLGMQGEIRQEWLSTLIRP